MLVGLGNRPNQVFVCLHVIMDASHHLAMIFFYSAESKRAHTIRDAFAESLIKNSWCVPALGENFMTFCP
jgi:hypothetical protein